MLLRKPDHSKGEIGIKQSKGEKKDTISHRAVEGGITEATHEQRPNDQSRGIWERSAPG